MSPVINVPPRPKPQVSQGLPQNGSGVPVAAAQPAGIDPAPYPTDPAPIGGAAVYKAPKGSPFRDPSKTE
jgi:hypothetical protein